DKDSKNAKESPPSEEKADAPPKAGRPPEGPKTEAPPKAGRPAEGPSTEASPPSSSLGTGEAAVAWEAALVRDTPKTGNLVTRLPRGTKVKVGSSKDGWYQIKFGDGFANEGWVYRGAIGR